MCNSVVKVIKNQLSQDNGTKEEVDEIFKEMQKKGKICYEAWG